MHFELKIPAAGEQLTDDEFFEFCRQNRDLKFERNANGQIIFGMPTGANTGRINSKIIARLQFWAESTDGEVFDSSTGFKLPDGTTRSPDASWMPSTQWNSLSKEQKKKFPPLCPDFVVEILSENDYLEDLQKKMEDYLENGCRLGWLIDPTQEKVYIYHPRRKVETIFSFNEKLSGEEILKGFELDLSVLK